MGIEVVNVGFCPQYWSTWEIPSSKGDGSTYIVTLAGTGYCNCTCPAFQHNKSRDCKHLRIIWNHGCLYNPQWKDAGPNDYAKAGIKLTSTGHDNIIDDKCPGCQEPMTLVRIAI